MCLRSKANGVFWVCYSRAGTSTNPRKLATMVTWPRPTNIKALRGFLGLIGYCRRFVKHYGIISRPLMELLKKDGFKKGPKAKTAFV